MVHSRLQLGIQDTFKMQVLALLERISVLLGICSPSDEINFQPKFYQNLRIVFCVMNLLMMIVFEISYGLAQFELGMIVDFLYAALQVAATTSMSLSYISIVHQRQNIRRTFNGVQNIVDRCKF